MPLAVILMMLNSCYCIWGYGYLIGLKEFDESQVTMKYHYPLPDYSSCLDCNGYYVSVRPNKEGVPMITRFPTYYVFYPDGTMVEMEQKVTKDKTLEFQFVDSGSGVYKVNGDTIIYEIFSPSHPYFGGYWTMRRGQAIIINHHHLRQLSITCIEKNRDMLVPDTADLRFVECDALPEPDVLLKHKRWMWSSASEKRKYYKSKN